MLGPDSSAPSPPPPPSEREIKQVKKVLAGIKRPEDAGGEVDADTIKAIIAKVRDEKEPE